MQRPFFIGGGESVCAMAVEDAKEACVVAVMVSTQGVWQVLHPDVLVEKTCG